MINKTTVILTFLCTLFFYTTINQWLAKKTAQNKITELTNEIAQTKQKAESDNQIVANNEQEKVKLENQSQERQEQMNEQLKDNDCANRFVPMPVSASLYNRAKNLRESTDTSQSIK
ncbi:hypothetical protein A9G11_11915 [Gilliamella sp. wkB108]|uniref:DUF2570 domain-containing protein n=1 Tax=Gilliamella sp. wkB108 TaxID=3120256 RepID=UPI00080DB3EE|nr:DUF2570 domain-containing protein [Gilliamella apicola]OCG28203.1 hypothetical protein A9G11_11915 [Gilliamella apicola]